MLDRIRVNFLKEHANYISSFLPQPLRFTSRIRTLGERPFHINSTISRFISEHESMLRQFTAEEQQFVNFTKQYISKFKEICPSLYYSEFRLEAIEHTSWRYTFSDIPMLADEDEVVEIARPVPIEIPEVLVNPIHIRKVVYNDKILECPDDCCVCAESIDSSSRLSCGHYIHKACVVKSGKSQCPMCRAEVALSYDELDEIEQVRRRPQQQAVDRSRLVYPQSLQYFIRDIGHSSQQIEQFRNELFGIRRSLEE